MDEGGRMNMNLLRRTRTMMPVRTELENEAGAQDESDEGEGGEAGGEKCGREAGRSCGSGTVIRGSDEEPAVRTCR
jgi:hypothetical protein